MKKLILIVLALLGQVALAAQGQSYLDLNLMQSRYLGEVQSSAQTSNFTFLSGDMNLQGSAAGFDMKLNPVAQNAFNAKNEFYFGIPEGYVQPRRLGSGYDLTFGRQKRHWSYLDEEFNLGVWQPQLRWDYLAPQQQGLTGIFFDVNISDEWKLTVFTSPIFFPDQGPNYQLENGVFSSDNRWFREPQGRLALFGNRGVGRDAPLYFQIDRPSEEQVVMNSSFGLGVSYRPSQPFWAQLNYAYKPQNQIHLGVECKNCVSIAGPGPVEVTAVIHPSIVKHHVLTAETGFERSDDAGYLSVSADVPNKSDNPADYEESPLDSMLITGLAYKHYVFSIMNAPSWLKYSYLRVFKMASKDRQGLVDSDQVHSSLERYPYREIAAVELKTRLSQRRSNQLNLRNRYNYSVPEKGGWLSAALDWSADSLTWSLGLDFLGTGVGEDSTNAGLFTKYRANDRVFAGVSYVF